ncbi:MAG: M23 family metallopeptidase [Bacteroidales bacterium]
MNIPVLLSGNFGELREDHFHMGLDFTTKRQTGIPVFSIADGQVVRVKVSYGGYGKALYVRHSNGYMSVYAHLHKFRPEIEQLTQDQQYKFKNYVVDINCEARNIFIEKGEVLAYSGNTGGSSGPHLHFEIRNSDGDMVYNPLAFYHLSDNTSPVVSSVFAYATDLTSKVSGLKNKERFLAKCLGNSKYTITEPIRVSGSVGFGIEAIDRTDDKTYRYGVYDLKLYSEDKLLFESTFDSIPYENVRHSNSYLDYYEYVKNRRYVNKLWREALNDLIIYKTQGNGTVKLTAGEKQDFVAVLKDFNGNTSTISFSAIGVDKPSEIEKIPNEARLYKAQESIRVNGDYFFVSMDSASLFSDEYLSIYKCQTASNGCLASFQIDFDNIPLRKQGQLVVLLSQYPSQLRDKLAIMRELENRSYGIDFDNDGKFLRCSFEELGRYNLLVDTVAPNIMMKKEPISHSSKTPHISFRAYDNLSGVKSVNAFIDNEWILLEYTQSQSLYHYVFDRNRLTVDKNHLLEIELEDRCGNRYSYKKQFYY